MALKKGIKPKHEIKRISESLLGHYTDKPLIDKYTIYQHLMDYWAETMQDDFYELAADGWSAGNIVNRVEKKTKKGDREIVKEVQGIEGLEGRLIPPVLMIQEYFEKEQKVIDDLEIQVESLTASMEEFREEHSGEEGLLGNAVDDKGKISKVSLDKAIRELGKRSADNAEEYDLLHKYKGLMEDEKKAREKIRIAKAELEKKVIAQYPKLTIDENKTYCCGKEVDAKYRKEN
jgi:type I restriction enzyme M protein